MKQMQDHFWMLKEFLLFKKVTLMSIAIFAAILILYMFTLTISGANNSLLSITFLMLGIFFFWLNILMGVVLWDRRQSVKQFERFISYLKPNEVDLYFPIKNEETEKQNFIAMKEKAQNQGLNLDSALSHISQMPQLEKRLGVPHIG